MGLKIQEAQRNAKSMKGDQKESSGNRKSVFQMLGRIYAYNFLNVLICNFFSRGGGLLLCLLGSFSHTAAAPCLHIFLQVSHKSLICKPDVSPNSSPAKDRSNFLLTVGELTSTSPHSSMSPV